MIFFISHSAIALALAINIVIVATIIIIGLNLSQDSMRGKNRYKRNTPAVTRVDECTRALTGVGAAIAAGNQLEKGICALLVIAATITRKGTHLTISVSHVLMIIQ